MALRSEEALLRNRKQSAGVRSNHATESDGMTTLTLMQKWIIALTCLAIAAAWQVGLRAFTPAATQAENIAEVAAVLNRKAVACLLDQLADHRLENSAAHGRDAQHHRYPAEANEGTEAEPRRIEQLVNPQACTAFLDKD